MASSEMMSPTGDTRFQNREDAARQLAIRFGGRELINPLVLAIPRGGVVTGAVLARELRADLDVVLSRKLRAPMQPELAIGAVSEDGQVTFNPRICEYVHPPNEYIESEKNHQINEIAKRKGLIRRVRPQARIEGRSVIVTDDGIATGATMLAALQVARTQKPRELIVAVPIASTESLNKLRHWSDDTVCLLCLEDFGAIGEFYDDFSPVEDQEVVGLLQKFAPTPQTA